MSELDGKLLIVTSATSYRDTIYIGICTRFGDLLCLRRASMILRYAGVGVPGLASAPQQATRLRPATGPGGQAWIPLSSVSAIIEADFQAWEGSLGISRG